MSREEEDGEEWDRGEGCDGRPDRAARSGSGKLAPGAAMASGREELMSYLEHRIRPRHRRSERCAIPLLLVPTILLWVLPQQSEAQRTPTDGEIRGQVIDEVTERGIPGAAVQFLDHLRRVRASTVTDETGAFHLTRLPPGPFQLRVRTFGYDETETPAWQVQVGETLFVTIRLHAERILLAPLEVVARTRSASPVLQGFYHRMERSPVGTFFDRDAIERRNPARITDLLVDVPGVRLESGGGMARDRIATFGRSIGDCPVQVYVDGVLASRGGAVPLDELASPLGLEGVEVYRGLSGVPAEFMNEQARCGVIALWTRRGG
jgi:hypothetical protein